MQADARESHLAALHLPSIPICCNNPDFLGVGAKGVRFRVQGPGSRVGLGFRL